MACSHYSTDPVMAASAISDLSHPVCVQALATEAFVLRLCLLVGLGSFAAATRQSLDSVESVVGAVCVVFSSLLLPTLFYASIRRQLGTDDVKLWACGSFILLFGGALMTSIVVQTALKVLGVVT